MNGWEDCIAAAECGYKEIDRQLTEQFIHGLNYKDMLGKNIKELTTQTNDEQITCEGVLVWAKRVDAQRVQATILNSIMETHHFNEVKIALQTKDRQDRLMHKTVIRKPCRYCTLTVSSIWENVSQMQEDRSLQKGLQKQKGAHST